MKATGKAGVASTKSLLADTAEVLDAPEKTPVPHPGILAISPYAEKYRSLRGLARA